MEEVKRLRVKWCGLKGSIMQLREKVQEALTTELETVNSESVLESWRILVFMSTEQLKLKLQQIIELDGAIAKAIQEDRNIWFWHLSERSTTEHSTYAGFIKKTSQPPLVWPQTLPPTVIDRAPPHPILAETTSELTAGSLPETAVTKKPPSSDTAPPTHVSGHISEHTRDMHQSHTRLPKLPLSTFDGIPLQWQTSGTHSWQQWIPIQFCHLFKN